MLAIGRQGLIQYLSKRTIYDILYALGLLIGFGIVFNKYHHFMDIYEQVILFMFVPAAIYMGWFWKPIKTLLITSFICALIAVMLYQQQLIRADEVFFLKYLLSSQSAILWMSVFLIISTVFYWIGFLSHSLTIYKLASQLCWYALFFGLVGMLVRWYESYLIGSDIGHIPISNLYEVFILFCLITSLFYLYYQEQFQTYALGPFILLIIAASDVFLMWYSIARDAQQIQPLVPALQSWWMKIHVPANFIGYGCFSLAAMTAIAYLIRCRGKLINRLPSLLVLDDIMYKAITVGFTFFTIATILGALWAADAWGGYWSWDPKETWALIVWLNYAAWLHLRLVKGLRGEFASWWALIGLLVTTFAFLGVNLFLSGLHSYGQL